MLRIFVLCEILGEWPTAIDGVLIALLPKAAGGLRPIGIFPTFVRVWFQLRAPYIRRWEADHERPYFYAGAAKGADVALWLQAAHLEHAALTQQAAAATLVDLVKAFERLSHVGLLTAAKRWEYPMWALRLSIAAYRLGRRVSIQGVLSAIVVACRGITAGSSFATTELRLLLLAALDNLHAAFPSLPLHVYVDDMFLAALGAPRHVCMTLTRATRQLVTLLQAAALEVSDTKSEGVASSPWLCRQLSAALADYGISFSTSCKSLGGGCRCHPQTQRQCAEEAAPRSARSEAAHRSAAQGGGRHSEVLPHGLHRGADVGRPRGRSCHHPVAAMAARGRARLRRCCRWQVARRGAASGR
jgi:hypothetical protein